jgi:hypothetical protein
MTILRPSRRVAAACAGAAALVSSAARANPEPLPYSYVPETLEKGQLEVEQYADFVPSKALDGNTGKPVNFAGLQFQTELEYGLTPRLELGLYVVLSPDPASGSFQGAPVMPEGTGVKQRLKYHLTDAATAPVDLSTYLEIEEKTQEFEIEAKVIAGRRFGPVRAIANFVVEQEIYYDGKAETELFPSGGLVYQASYTVQPGIESWMHVEFPDDGGTRAFGQGPHVYVGPTLLLQWQKLWWSTGAYFRVTDVTRETAPGDAFGKVWLRLLVGVPL